MSTNINITDPRVRRRCQRALSFTLAQIPETTARPVSTRLIDKHFGQSQHSLSRQLRSLLLSEADQHYNSATGKCKQYVRNTEGCELLHNLLDPQSQFQSAKTQHISTYVDQFSTQLSTGKFDYADKSNRHWHPLQNLPSDIRKQQLARYGYCHIYDIRCAAPSIILHLASDLGITVTQTHTIEHYIQHKHTVRRDLAQQLQISQTDVKRLINMLFNGAPVGHISRLATTQLLRGDSRTIEAVKQNPYIQALRADISSCWSKIAKHTVDGEYVIPRTYHSDGRKKRITSTDRWKLYFAYERQIMDSVTRYLDKQMALYLIEHDGWSSNIQVDLSELTQHVRTSTGIHTIEFEYECYTDHPVLRTR